MIDVIIVSHAKSVKHTNLTQRAIKTADKSAGVPINVIVVEQEPMVNYPARTIHYDFPFNYNKCLNLGVSHGDAKYIVVCNNDLIFHKDWAKNLMIGFEMGYDSVSPYCPVHHRPLFERGNHVHEGFRIRYEVSGWCIGLTRELYDRIGGFDESVTFWYSDNLYADQIQHVGAKHALVCNSFVEHDAYGSKTLKTERPNTKQQLMGGQEQAYNLARRKYATRTTGNEDNS